MLLNRQRGQSTLEYALLIAAVVAGLVVMQMYVKRGMAGRLKSATDELGEQYDPTAFNSNYTTNTHSKRNETVANKTTNSILVDAETTTRTGSESVTNWTENDTVYSHL